MSKSIAERYEALAERADRSPAVRVGAQPTRVHRAAVHLMASILDLSEQVNPEAVPAPLRALARMLRKMEDELAMEFATVPEEAILDFMRQLIDELCVITGDHRAPAAAASELPA